MNARTFYITEDDGHCWWRTDQWTLPEARHEAALWARDSLGDWGRSRFVGKVVTRLSEHEPGCSIESHLALGECSFEREAWEFEVYES